MMMDRPLSYWIAVAGMGFENDFNRLLDKAGLSQAELAERLGCSPAYVSKVLSGAGNLQLKTMAKWARAIGAIVQIRLIEEGKEVVRVVDYETARALDDAAANIGEGAQVETAATDAADLAPVLQFHRMVSVKPYFTGRASNG